MLVPPWRAGTILQRLDMVVKMFQIVKLTVNFKVIRKMFICHHLRNPKKISQYPPPIIDHIQMCKGPFFENESFLFKNKTPQKWRV